MRFTQSRSLEIHEDGDLTVDMYCNETWDADTVEFISPQTALKIANLIAEEDGGWSREEEDQSA